MLFLVENLKNKIPSSINLELLINLDEKLSQLKKIYL